MPRYYRSTRRTGIRSPRNSVLVRNKRPVFADEALDDEVGVYPAPTHILIGALSLTLPFSPLQIRRSLHHQNHHQNQAAKGGSETKRRCKICQRPRSSPGRRKAKALQCDTISSRLLCLKTMFPLTIVLITLRLWLPPIGQRTHGPRLRLEMITFDRSPQIKGIYGGTISP